VEKHLVFLHFFWGDFTFYQKVESKKKASSRKHCESHPVGSSACFTRGKANFKKKKKGREVSPGHEQGKGGTSRRLYSHARPSPPRSCQKKIRRQKEKKGRSKCGNDGPRKGKKGWTVSLIIPRGNAFTTPGVALKGRLSEPLF